MAIWETILMAFKRRFTNTITIVISIAIIFIAVQAIKTPAIAENSGKIPGNNSWQGVVTYVVDGDTLRIMPLGMPANTASRKIRIDGIDAPESCQTYGPQSTAALKQLIASKTVTVVSKRTDDYGRDVAKITVNNVDVGGWMVSNGHAWSYHYRHSAGPYRVEEEAAARARAGLFADKNALEPRFFRREHGTCYVATDAKDATENPRKRYK
jgi:micrococcal nuclease